MTEKKLNNVFIIVDSQRKDMVGVYGNPAMDLFSQKIVGWSMKPRMTKALVTGLSLTSVKS